MVKRTHNEYFRAVQEKKCPTCGANHNKFTFILSWGEYVRGKWRTIKHFCSCCFQREVATQLLEHKEKCGCEIKLVAYQGFRLPLLMIDFAAKNQFQL